MDNKYPIFGCKVDTDDPGGIIGIQYDTFFCWHMVLVYASI